MAIHVSARKGYPGAVDDPRPPPPEGLPGQPPSGYFYWGSSVGDNALGAGSDPTIAEFEAWLGVPLTAYRGYVSKATVDSGLTQAQNALRTRISNALATRALPFVSTKTPSNDWAGIAAGERNAWLDGMLDVACSFTDAVWLVFHHEPKGDGTPTDFKAMQRYIRARLEARSDGGNVYLWAILNGYQFVEDLAGFRAWRHDDGVHAFGYDRYYPGNFSSPASAEGALDPAYEISDWGYKTAICETGCLTDTSNRGRAEDWVEDLYSRAHTHGGVEAVCWWNQAQYRMRYLGATENLDSPDYERRRGWRTCYAGSWTYAMPTVPVNYG